MKRRGINNLVIGIYFHPEAYPPTLNAIGELSECFDHITVIHRPHLAGSWKYPANVKAIASGKYISSTDQEKASLKNKIGFFIHFTFSLFRACKRDRPSLVLLYDSLSLFAYYLVKPFLQKHKVWYHNHDVTEPEFIRKYSIGWFAAKQELQAFKYLDIFSLPTNDRLTYFPMDDFKGKYFFIPNYPAKKFYAPFYKSKRLDQTIRIIFQGSIGPNHGLEEIMPLLKDTICGYGLELVLKGPCREEYRKLYTELAEKHQVREKLFFLGVTPYAEVPIASSSCHIGIGILAGKDVMNTTLGTASNKLYEYAAVGLPVIYYNSENFTRYLGKYSWAVPANLDTLSISRSIVSIITQYDDLCTAANRDFLNELNYEKGFAKMKKYLLKTKKPVQ